MADWHATVNEITEDGRVDVHYSCEDYPDDTVGVCISLPADVKPTEAWLLEEMEKHSGHATDFWDRLDDQKRASKRITALRMAVGKVTSKGKRPRRTPIRSKEIFT